MQTTAKHIRRDAEEQAAGAVTDARRRSVISRAYYASYHRCTRWEGLLPHKSRHSPKGGTHAQLIGRLQAPNPDCGQELMKRSRILGELLSQQLTRRVGADYKLKDQTDKASMDRQLEGVQAVFQTCADPNS
ncbi:hypothetical protein [Roseateles sp.]|uniref:hypothetical protein n=1 Tax=Roseateles sp. TaxID=1971397 RepID=UPI002F412364